MSSEVAPTGGEDAPTYAYRASALGAPRQFSLAGDGIEWATARGSGRTPYQAVRRVRLSFQPTSMQTQRFVTEVWAEGSPKLTLVSTSCKSMFEQERLDAHYTAFVGELHRRVAQAGATVRWEQGKYPVIYWPGLAAFLCVALGLAALAVRALQAHAIGSAFFVAAFLALFLWQGGNFFRRNRPGHYRPQALPAEVMPKR